MSRWQDLRRTARAAGMVAEREFVERATSRAFLISNAVLVAVLLVGFAIPVLTAGDDGRRIAYVPQAEDVARVAQERAAQLDIELEVVALPDENAARAAVQPPDDRPASAADVPDEQFDAALLADRTVLTWQDLPSDLESLLTVASREVAVRSALDDVTLTPAQQEALLAPPALTVESVGGEQAEEGPALFTGAIAVFLLYGLLLFYGQYVAQGVVEEKSSRVVEVLLSTVRPTALLFGKVVGLTALGLAQSLVLALVGTVAAVAFLDVTVPTEAYGTIALAIGWFGLGFLLYATVFAVGASLVSRQEDLQSTLMPAFIPIIVGFLVAQYALQNPQSSVSLVASLVPFTAPLVQPLRYGAQVMQPWEVPVALALCVLTIAALVPAAARLYSGSILRFGGRVRVGEAWRAARS